MTHKHTPVALIILDGWGYRIDPEFNAIKTAATPNWDNWWRDYPHTLIDASGQSVGLPKGQMGNSEVGHMHIGAGRLLQQDFTRINEAISNNQLIINKPLQEAIAYAKQQQKAIHLLGLLSPGGVHSHEQQIMAVCREIARHEITHVYLHAFLDGRDTPPRSAEKSLRQVAQLVTIASIIGRYYAMDRDQRWQRTKIAYDLLCGIAAAHQASDAISALHQAYARGESDEFVQATSIGSSHAIQDDDVVIFLNFRADRARQLSHALLDEKFSHFERKQVCHNLHFLTLTDYAGGVNAQVMFPPQPTNNSLGEYLSRLNYRQLRIAETEKYPHVTYFLNGGIEQPFPGEERILVPSPQVATYDLQPEMSAPEITEILVKIILQQQFDVILCNFANADMVGHTGNYAATQRAISCLDSCLGKIVNALKQVGGELLITADHGNAEKMFDPITQQPFTAHTSELVPFMYLGRAAQITTSQGTLIDIAPTLLYILGLEKPTQMTGNSLVKFVEEN